VGVVASVAGIPLTPTLVNKIYENPDTTELVIPSSYPSPTLFKVGTRTEYRSAVNIVQIIHAYRQPGAKVNTTQFRYASSRGQLTTTNLPFLNQPMTLFRKPTRSKIQPHRGEQIDGVITTETCSRKPCPGKLIVDLKYSTSQQTRSI
jgi:hypothetical protein